MKIKKSVGEKCIIALNIIFLTIVCAISIYPFIHIVSISFSSLAGAAKSGFHFYPIGFNFASYKAVFQADLFYRLYFNTVFRTVVGTLMALIVTASFAYAVSRTRMPHRKILMKLMLFTMIFNGGMIPTYLNIRNLGLIDTMWALILPGLISAYNVIIIKSFFEGIPESLIESAAIDGANHITIFYKIVLPISKPVIFTVGLWVAVSHWNAWYDAMIYINAPEKQVMQNLLRRIIVENSMQFMEKGLMNTDVLQYNSDTLQAAAIMVTILPILCVYPFIQKHFVKGATIGAVKG